MSLTDYLLIPFSFIYGFLTDTRNWLYDTKFWEEHTFKVPIINVGNLTVGGTGKTPHVEYLVKLLKDKHSVTTLSRGYGRKTKGFIIANSSATAQTIGDEPYQFYRKFKDAIRVAVGENRVDAISKILNQRAGNDLIILDDAFQHRAVKPSLNLLLIDFSRPIYYDFTFPAGRLRERRHGAKRADVAIITKCPEDLSGNEQHRIKQNLQPYSKPNIPVFFTKIRYGKPQNCRFGEENIDLKKVVLLSGIANPTPFETFAKAKFEVIYHFVFKDHHNYSEKDFKEIRTNIKSDDISILMTEKDMVKFQPFLRHELLRDLSLYYLPIEIIFLENEMKTNFDKLITAHVNLTYPVNLGIQG